MGRGGLRAGAGRPKGTPNVKTVKRKEFFQRLGCDPIAGMAFIAMNKVKCHRCKHLDTPVEDCHLCFGTGWEHANLSVRSRVFSELASFMYPKLSAQKIDQKTEIHGGVRAELVYSAAVNRSPIDDEAGAATVARQVVRDSEGDDEDAEDAEGGNELMQGDMFWDGELFLS